MLACTFADRWMKTFLQDCSESLRLALILSRQRANQPARRRVENPAPDKSGVRVARFVPSSEISHSRPTYPAGLLEDPIPFQSNPVRLVSLKLNLRCMLHAGGHHKLDSGS